MADKDKPKNGRRTIKGTRATPVSPQHKPTGKKDSGGFKSPGFKSEGFTSGGRKIKTGPPPSIKSRDEQAKKKAPSERYATKKKPRKQPDLKPLDKPPGRAKPKSQAAKRRALRTTGGRKLFGQRKTGTTAKWPSSKRMTYKGMSATTRHGSVPTSGFVVSHEQKKRRGKPKRGR